MLLRRIAAEFGLKTRRATEHQMALLRSFLTEQADMGILPLIIIDEAHELSEDQFIILRSLLNFRDPKGGKAYQLILLGRPELDFSGVGVQIRPLKGAQAISGITYGVVLVK